MNRLRIAAAGLMSIVCAVPTGSFGETQLPTRYHTPAAHPEPEAAAVWRLLGASCVRKAIKDNQLEKLRALPRGALSLS